MKRDSLLKDIENFLRANQMQPTTFGKMALNDPRLVFDLRSGRDYRRSTEMKIREFMGGFSKGTAQ